MVGSEAKSGIAVWMHCISQTSEMVHQITVWSIQAGLLKLLHHYIFCTSSTLPVRIGASIRSLSTQKCCLDINGRHYGVEISEIIGGPGIIDTTGVLYGTVKIGHIGRPSKHEMFKEMSHAGARRTFVARTGIVKSMSRATMAVLRSGCTTTRNPLPRVAL